MFNKYQRESSRTVRNRYKREVLGGADIPIGMVVHHRDSNAMRGSTSNLELISISEHKQIHKERGYSVSEAQKQREAMFGQLFI